MYTPRLPHSLLYGERGFADWSYDVIKKTSFVLAHGAKLFSSLSTWRCRPRLSATNVDESASTKHRNRTRVR